jgi:hypothetical protein
MTIGLGLKRTTVMREIGPETPKNSQEVAINQNPGTAQHLWHDSQDWIVALASV